MRIVLISALLVIGCASSKTSKETTVRQTDSVRQETVSDTRHAQTRISISTDTAIGIRERSVTDSLVWLAYSLQLQLNECDGEQVRPRRPKVPIYQERTEDGLKAWVAIDTFGNIRFGARADSSSLVVRNTRQIDSVSSAERQSRFLSAVTATDLQSTIRIREEKQHWFFRNMHWLLPLAMIIIILFRARKLFF